MENTEITFKDMPITSEVDRAGMLEIYRKMLLIDLFQTKTWQMGLESAFAHQSHSEPSHHFANDRSTGFLVLNYEKPDCLSVFSTILKLGGRQMKNPYL